MYFYLNETLNFTVIIQKCEQEEEMISTWNAGDPGFIPGSGRFTGEGIGYTLQYSWVSHVAQLVKNLPAMQEIWV